MKLTRNHIFASVVTLVSLFSMNEANAENILRFNAPISGSSVKLVEHSEFGEWSEEKSCEYGDMIGNSSVAYECLIEKQRTVIPYLRNEASGSLVANGEPYIETMASTESSVKPAKTITNGFTKSTATNGAQYVGARHNIFGTTGSYASSQSVGFYFYKVSMEPGYWVGLSVNNVQSHEEWSKWLLSISEVRIYSTSGELLHEFNSISRASYTESIKIANYWLKPKTNYGNLYEKFYGYGNKNYVIRFLLK